MIFLLKHGRLLLQWRNHHQLPAPGRRRRLARRCENHELCSKNDELCIENEELCVKHEDFVLKTRDLDLK